MATDRVLVVSRSMPPDIGGYQRQMSIVLPLLRGASVCWVGAVRDRPSATTPVARRVGRKMAVPAWRLPRRVRGLADYVAVMLALGTIMLWRPDSLLLLSPTMKGGRALVAAAAARSVTVVARYPTAGDLGTVGGRRVARHPGVVPVVPGISQLAETPGFPVAHLPNAVEYVENQVISEPEGGTFLFVGRLISRKRADLLLDVWKEVGVRLPSWSLRIIGTGGTEPDSIEPRLRAAIASGELERCQIEGPLPDARSEFLTSDVLVFPSVRKARPTWFWRQWPRACLSWLIRIAAASGSAENCRSSTGTERTIPWRMHWWPLLSTSMPADPWRPMLAHSCERLTHRQMRLYSSLVSSASAMDPTRDSMSARTARWTSCGSLLSDHSD